MQRDLCNENSAVGFLHRFLKKMDEVKSLHNIDVPSKLSLLKTIHAEWMVQLQSQITAIPDKEIIHSGWKAAGIAYALPNGIGGLESLNLFHDIKPMMGRTQHPSGALRSYNEPINHYILMRRRGWWRSIRFGSRR